MKSLLQQNGYAILETRGIPAPYPKALGDNPLSRFLLRVNEGTTVQLAPWGTEGNEHFAFALSAEAFDAAFARLREDGIRYGDSFHDVGNQQGPGEESGARGPGRTLYFFDPNHHLLEIRSYA